MTSYYWEKHEKYVQNGRLTWYGDSADQAFWQKYWEEKITPEYYYNVAAQNLSDDPQGKILLREMAPGDLYLEAGCGAGNWVVALQKAGMDIEGIEYSMQLVEAIKGLNLGLPIRHGDALQIDRPADHYDGYLSFGVVEHRLEGPEAFLVEAHRVIKPNGKLIISVPSFGPLRQLKANLRMYKAGPVPPSGFFQYGFSNKDFAALLDNCGFEVMASYYLSTHRLLIEEVPLYRRAASLRGSRYWRRYLAGLLERRDGHMVLFVAQKI